MSIDTSITSRHIEVTDLTFGYGAKCLFEGFYFRSTKRITLLRGPSGCGKTTLLKLLGGYLDPQHGQISRTKGSALLTVQEDSLWPWLTGLQNIEMIAGVSRGDIEAFDLFPLIAPFYERQAYQMSYGQRRSIELIRALLKSDRLMLWDEPFNFLDRQRRDMVLQFITSEKNTTRFVLTSHYTENIPSNELDVFEFIGDAPFARLVHTSDAQL